MLNRPYIVCRCFKVGSTAVADPGFQKDEEKEIYVFWGLVLH